MEKIAPPADLESTRFNPFPGLRPFEPDEDHIFFGRERETDELLRRLRTSRFVPVLGTSGSGKSSLVRSGLIPSLHSGFMVQAGSAWRIAVFRPGGDPIGNLAEALGDPDVLGADDDEMRTTQRMLLETTLRRSALGLADCVRHARLPEHENLLVVVDQFEELFRFRESRREHGSRDEAVAFAKLLLGAASQQDVSVYVVITMRSDFIGDCMDYPGLPEAINEGQYLIPRMTREELRQAISGPVAVGGGEIAPRLVSRLLNEVGDDPDQLPVLQHALMRSWDAWTDDHAEGEPLDLRHYESIGTMTEALSRHAEEAYAELGDGRPREIAERMFKALTDKRMDDRGVRRPTPVHDVAAITGAPESEVVEVVEVFRRPGRSFLMPPSGVTLATDSILDLSHESLMRNWLRLVDWVEEETASGKAYRRLCRSARRYEQKEGSLWVEPELAIGLKWRAETKPTEVWARRYDPNLDRALSFLKESEEAHAAALRAEEEERRAKLRRARVLATVLGTAAVVTAVFGLLALRAGRIAREAEKVAQAEARTASAVTKFMTELFEVVDPETGQGSSITAREILDEGAARIDSELADQPEIQARLKSTVGKVYGSLGLNEEAESLLLEALQAASANWGETDPRTLEARHRLAEVEWNRGRYEESLAHYEAVLEGRQQVHGDSDPATLETLAGLARTYESLGRFDEAESAARRAWEAQREVLGDDAPATLRTLFRLGSIHYEAGRLDEAEKTYLEAWSAQKSTLGEEHPDAVATMGNLGELYVELGRYADADTLYRRNLENQQQRFGDEHPRTLLALFGMANLNFESGLWSVAEEQHVSVLEARRRVLGEEHPATLESETILAWLLKEEDREEEAIRLSRHAYETGVRTLGEDDLQTREYANVHASVLSEMGRHSEAEVLYRKNLEINERRLGRAHPMTGTARNNLAVCYSNWGRNDQSAALHRENLEIAREAYGEDNPSVLFYMINVSSMERSQGRPEEALAISLDTLERHRRVLGPDNQYTYLAMREAASNYRALKRMDEAEAIFQDWVAGHRRLFGDEHPETLTSLSWLAGFYEQLGRNAEALALREEILEGRRRIYGEEDWNTDRAYGSLIWVVQLEGDSQRALALRRKRLENARAIAIRNGAGPHDMHRYSRRLVNAVAELQNPEEAVRFAEQACEMTGYGNRNYMGNLANAYFKSGRTADAIAAQETALELVSKDDPRARNWMEERLAEFHEAAGNLEPKRRLKAQEIARKKDAAEAPDASPRNRDSYAQELLRALPDDLRDPEEALRVARALNEDTDFANPSYLTTLALAYYQTGDAARAVETQSQALELIPENDLWSATNHGARLEVYRGEGLRELDVASLSGSWSGRAGPVEIRVTYARDGDYVVGTADIELPWGTPAGAVIHRFHVRTGEAELQQADSGWTNLRWEAAEYRYTEEGALIMWHHGDWFVVRFERVVDP